jgi:hypothetical protein
MAKKQTRRSISVSRTTYERLKSFCETNNISMSQFVEARVGDFLGEGVAMTTLIPVQPRPTLPAASPAPARPAAPMAPPAPKAETRPSSPAIPMTSAAARFVVEPPPPVIKRREPEDQAAPKPAEKRPDQIFTF